MENDDNDIFEGGWLETVVIGDFRVWHIIASCLGILLSILIMVCCCIRFRIPRTKQEIEADFQRKQITKKFREKLQQIKNTELDDMDLQKAFRNRQHKAISRIQVDLLNSSAESLTKELNANYNLKNNIQIPV